MLILQLKLKTMKKYTFYISYTLPRSKDLLFGNMSLFANDMLHANRLFGRLYIDDSRCSPGPFEKIGELENVSIISVSESTTLN